jgi:glycosyltransferase involved in cell wall biosynthesis
VAELEVSVVIPTRDRAEHLPRLFDGLRRQTLDADSFEVIVVADGASPATHAVLAGEVARGGPQLRVVTRAHAGGPGAARNAGWRAARGKLIAFTDDDCVPTPGWLGTGLNAARPLTLVQGITRAHPEDLEHAWVFSRTVEGREPRSAVRDLQHLLSPPAP